jgi:ribosomal protein S6
METQENLRHYELMLILDFNMNQDLKEKTVKEVEDVLTQSGAIIKESRVWMEKHNLTFEIQNCKEGTYFLITFESKSSSIEGVQDTLKLNESLLRFSITKVDPKKSEPAQKK